MYQYSPQEDITPYELALIVPVLAGIAGQGEGGQVLAGGFLRDVNGHIEHLPAEAKRHFRLDQ